VNKNVFILDIRLSWYYNNIIIHGMIPILKIEGQKIQMEDRQYSRGRKNDNNKRCGKRSRSSSIHSI